MILSKYLLFFKTSDPTYKKQSYSQPLSFYILDESIKDIDEFEEVQSATPTNQSSNNDLQAKALLKGSYCNVKVLRQRYYMQFIRDMVVVVDG